MDISLFRSYLEQTRILRAPLRALATFGATRIEYHLISPVEDLPGKTRLREGTVTSRKPAILTPEAFAERFQGFGEEAGEALGFLTPAYRDLLRALEYNFKNDGFSTRVLSEGPQVVTERMQSELDSRDAKDQAVIDCPDGAWSLALMKFSLDEASRSFPTHVRDLDRRGLFDPSGKERGRRRKEIEALFSSSGDPAVREALGRKLKEYGLFEEYEDRYLSLFR